MTSRYLQCGRYRFPLSGGQARPLVMGILNVTPDSFSDGGRFVGLESALSRAEQMIADGVDIIDIGGESTRPGAQPLSLQEELDRVMPVVYALRDCGRALSIDTYKPGVMREAIAAGVDMVNDINAFQAEGALRAVKDGDCGLCMMHMRGNPQTMQDEPHYQDVVAEVTQFLAARIADAEAWGVEMNRLCVDPGFGFGKKFEHNLALLRNLRQIKDSVGIPMLVGLSRKGMIGQLTGRSVDQRLAGSLGAALAACMQGAAIVRVHDVAETVDILKVWQVTRP